MRSFGQGLIGIWVWLLLIAGMFVAVAAMAEENPQLASSTGSTEIRSLKPHAARALQNDYRKIVINTQTRTLTLYTDDIAIATYPVGVGKPGFATPKGQYTVMRMMKNPGWENPYQPASTRTRIVAGNNNPLGTRWIGFLNDGKGEYGIHGTNRPDSVGRFSSHGCVRMYIQDAEALYDQVGMGTPVEVI